MFKYKNEAAFSKVVCEHYRRKGLLVQRIESGITSKGIPDVYLAGQIQQTFIELKRQHCNISQIMRIDWRPGQQTWMYDYYQHTGKLCYTMACFNDGIIIIPMRTIYINNIIPATEVKYICSTPHQIPYPL